MTPDDLLAGARSWYDDGYCVVPTHEDGGKRPFGLWKEYQAQRPTWEQLETWLRSGRYTGIGVITGAASGGVEMIEIEGPLDLAAARLQAVIDAAARFEAIGIPDLLRRVAAGCAEQSAGGGLHLFIRVADGAALGNTKLAHQGGKIVAETRGEGGFVVVAPTAARTGHPDGAAYRLIDGATPANTVDVTAEERDLLHELVRQALDEPVEPDPEPDPATPRDAYAGQSPFDHYRDATTWREILEPAGWKWHHRDADGRDHWVRPGKDPREGASATTIDDGPMYVFSGNAGLPVEQGLSKAHVYAWLHHGGDLKAAHHDLRDRGFGSSSAELPPWEAQLDPDATEEEKAEAEQTWVRQHLPLLDWGKLWDDQTEEEWLVEPLIAKRRLIALYSAPKVGKSLLMLEMAAALASGREILGSAPREPIRTLYVDFENDPRADIRERLRDMGYGPADLENLCYLSFPNIAKFDTKAGADQLLAAVLEYGCQIVVIDTVSRAVEGEESSNDTWLSFYRHTGMRLKQAEVALVRLDHSGKDESRGQRGASAKSGDVDAVWRLSKIGDVNYRLTCEANRFPVTQTIVDLERLDAPLRHKADLRARDKITEEICRKYAKAGIPRDGTIGPREAARILKDAGIAFTKAQVNNRTLAEYCRRHPAWETPPMDAA